MLTATFRPRTAGLHQATVSIHWVGLFHDHNLLGQGFVRHGWPFRAGPWQGLPPYFGTGLVQVRASTVIPVPQDTLHGVKTNQLDQPPFTIQ